MRRGASRYRDGCSASRRRSFSMWPKRPASAIPEGDRRDRGNICSVLPWAMTPCSELQFRESADGLPIPAALVCPRQRRHELGPCHYAKESFHLEHVFHLKTLR